MNYIKHLNAVFQQFSKDSRLNPAHISLYIALFQYWNINRFSEFFYINREEVMKMAKIGSKATYHRCLRGLDDWKYICYLPSHNMYKGSRVRMLKFGTSYETSIERVPGQAVGQALVHYINNIKHVINNNKREHPKNENDVLEYFKKEKWPAIEARKFYNYYQSTGWRLGGKVKIINWHSAAKNWMLKSKAFKTDDAVSQNRDNLKTSKYKNYGEPL